MANGPRVTHHKHVLRQGHGGVVTMQPNVEQCLLASSWYLKEFLSPGSCRHELSYDYRRPSEDPGLAVSPH